MNITKYYNINSIDGVQQISFTRNQASSFAKGVAGDFNPIHDEEHRRFCVPGDLLFSVFLAQYGVNQEMRFEFSGMVVDTTQLIFPEQVFPEQAVDVFSLQDTNGKNYMDISASGDNTKDADFIATLSEKYVQFSSKTFPDILVPLMDKENVMINPARPLVIYKNMEIHLDKLSGDNIDLKLNNASLKNNGRKGEVRLEFSILSDGEEIGHGAKNLLLSGLREFNSVELGEVTATYAQRKSDYLAKQ